MGVAVPTAQIHGKSLKKHAFQQDPHSVSIMRQAAITYGSTTSMGKFYKT